MSRISSQRVSVAVFEASSVWAEVRTFSAAAIPHLRPDALAFSFQVGLPDVALEVVEDEDEEDEGTDRRGGGGSIASGWRELAVVGKGVERSVEYAVEVSRQGKQVEGNKTRKSEETARCEVRGDSTFACLSFRIANRSGRRSALLYNRLRLLYVLRPHPVLLL